MDKQKLIDKIFVYALTINFFAIFSLLLQNIFNISMYSYGSFVTYIVAFSVVYIVLNETQIFVKLFNFLQGRKKGNADDQREV